MIILVTIYSKTEQADIGPHEIRQIILSYEKQQSETNDETPQPETPESDEAIAPESGA